MFYLSQLRCGSMTVFFWISGVSVILRHGFDIVVP